MLTSPSIHPRAVVPTVPLMGLDVAAFTERDTVDHVLNSLRDGEGGWLCTANLDILRQWHESDEVRDLVSGADLVVADGMPLLWAAELQGSPLPERVAGSTLIMSLTAGAAEAGASIFMLGGNPGTAEGAMNKLTELSPGLELAGTLCPPFGFENDATWLDRIEQSLRDAEPDIVYVALGSPKTERLIAELRTRLPEMWFMGCGISFSFLAGEVRRAPVIVQRLGFEWLHRMIQEPKRLYRRYLVQGIPFLVELMWSALTLRRDPIGRAAR